MKRYFLLLILAVSVFQVSGLAQSTRKFERDGIDTNQNIKRIALVIGNSAYTKANPLPNPNNDAIDMTKALKEVGFEVLSGVDLNKRQMETLIREFGTKLANGGVGLFYYAGHGVQVNGENYLVPVDADIPEEDEVSYATVPLSLLLTKLTTAKNDLNIIILDACRNNPFARSWRTFRDVGNNYGLAKISPPTGTLVLYATEPGKVASDGTGRNGLFTEALLKQIKQPNVEYDQMVKELSSEVWRRSNRQQLPWKEGNSLTDFYFVKDNVASVVPQNQSIESSITKTNLTTGEQSFWQEAERKNTIVMYESYISNYPNGEYVALARVKVDDLKRVAENSIIVQSAQSFFLQATNESNIERKIELFTKAIETFPQHTGAFLNRGIAYYVKKDLDRAIADYTKAIEINPLFARAYLQRRLAYRDKENYDNAIADYNQVISIEPNNSIAYSNLGQTYNYKRNYDFAIVSFNKAIAIDPNNSMAYFYRAQAFDAIRDYDRAIADFTKVIEMNPQFDLNYYYRGITYFNKRDYDRAITDFNKAITINPKDALSYYQRGKAYYDKDDYKQAMIDFNKAIE